MERLHAQQEQLRAYMDQIDRLIADTVSSDSDKPDQGRSTAQTYPTSIPSPSENAQNQNMAVRGRTYR